MNQRTKDKAWIPVSERLPDVDADYLVASKTMLGKQRLVCTSTYRKPEQEFINGWDISGVTHWRLPKGQK